MIYLDTCVLVYLVQCDTGLTSLIVNAMSRRAGDRFAISPLVEMECLVFPLKHDDVEMELAYRTAFETYRSIPLTRAVFEEAAQLRARHGLKVPDALHLATAKTSGCSALWTNDDRLAKAAPGYALSVRRL
ncbi:MAG: type II toxin-antitoxin system VapC family toxin [Propionibacteriaceae bacterium]|nr:type II toxin-antitoxin system VapC family toxin [Propionibacteriaceae bacterium]